MKNTPLYSSSSPIGIFDSGIGGLSICKEVLTLLPQESVIYLADSANAPYGEKSKEEIIRLSIKNTELLLALNCKLIIVACNTATTNAIATLRSQFDVPFIGIEPAIKPAALQSQAMKVGILATQGTLQSELFLATSEQFRSQFKIIEVQGKKLVQLIEGGQLQKTKPLLKKYLQPMVEAGVDNIVLGCSHYPFLIPFIKEIVPPYITIIDSGRAVAKQTQLVLQSNGLHNTTPSVSNNVFYTNQNLEVLTLFVNKIGVKKKAVSMKDF